MNPSDPKQEPAQDSDLDFELPAAPVVSRSRIAVIGAVAVALMAGAFVLRYVPLRREKAALVDAKVGERALPRLEAVKAKVLASDRALVLPATVVPFEETIIYARANGYVRRWLSSLGDDVKQGDLLAEIDTPDLDQELEQAKAQLAQAQAAVLQSKASRAYSGANLQRYQQLAPIGVASQQELDQHKAQAAVDEANVNVAEATVHAQEANIRRLTQLKSFARVTAPFDGKITRRFVDRGNLVTAGTSAPLYRITSIDPARVLIQVPQDVAPTARVKLPAKMTVREFGGRVFEGKVLNVAGELDPQSRTMAIVIDVPNKDGALLPGMYAQVSLSLPVPHRVLELPATAILSDASGVRVATVTSEGKIHFVNVAVERDTGPTVEISSGLTGDERVVKIANARLVEGESVDSDQ